jgi:hypothetical protein
MRLPAEERVDRSFWLVDREGERYFPIRIPRKRDASACLFRVSDGDNTIAEGREIDAIDEVIDLVVNQGYRVRAVPESDIRSPPSLIKLNARKILSYGTASGVDVSLESYWQALAFAVGQPEALWIDSAANAVRPKRRGDAYVTCSFNTIQGWCRIGIGLLGDGAAEGYEGLLARRAAIENAAGERLTWDTKEDRTRRQIFVQLPCNPNDRSDWGRQHDWLATRLPTYERLLELV